MFRRWQYSTTVCYHSCIFFYSAIFFSSLVERDATEGNPPQFRESTVRLSLSRCAVLDSGVCWLPFYLSFFVTAKAIKSIRFSVPTSRAQHTRIEKNL